MFCIELTSAANVQHKEISSEYLVQNNSTDTAYLTAMIHVAIDH